MKETNTAKPDAVQRTGEEQFQMNRNDAARIVAFICNWCIPENDDSFLESFPNLKPIRVMCTGRVNPGLILKAFESGAEGVAVLGCRENACHYVSGNTQAIANVEKVKALLCMAGYTDVRIGFFPLPPEDEAHRDRMMRALDTSIHETKV
jgi:coenzyme F420-reducing hydrogenase delta subunit